MDNKRISRLEEYLALGGGLLVLGIVLMLPWWLVAAVVVVGWVYLWIINKMWG